MYLTPVSFDGVSLNAAGYYQTIIPEDAPASWKANVISNSRANALPQFAGVTTEGVTLPLRIRILGSGSLGALKTLFDALDPDAPRLKKLIVQDTSGVNWAVYAAAQNLLSTSARQAVAVLYVPEPVWICETETTATWAVTASGQTKTLTVGGTAPALPTFEIKPSGANADNYQKSEAIVIYNKLDREVSIPFQIVSAWNTAALVTAGTLLASCNDVRIWADGGEVDHWMVRANNADTDIWINLSLSPKAEMTLKTAIASTGAVGEIQLSNSDKATLERLKREGRLAGAVLIDSELFTYDGLDAKLLKLGGVTRAQRGTSEAAHSAAATVRWIEHDYRLLYSNANAEARVTDDAKKPIFDLTASDNTVWVYSTFADQAQLAAGAWVGAALQTNGGSGIYTEDKNATPDVWPAEVLGLEIGSVASKGKWISDDANLSWRLYHPCGINSAAASGEKYRVGAKWPTLSALQKSANGKTWANLLTETSPVNASTWTSFTWSETTTGVTTKYTPLWLQLTMKGGITGGDGNLARMELDSATIKFVSANLPSVTRLTGTDNCQLEIDIVNETRGETITLAYPMAVGKTLTVDTANKVITYDGVPADEALAVYPPRAEWLALKPAANNVIRLDANTLGNLDITIKYRNRMVW